VFQSANLGKNWLNISGNLTAKNSLDIPVATLAIDPKNENRIWIGTDTGVYRTTDRGRRWESYQGNMPNVAVMALQYNINTGYLMAATFGRGVWRTIVK
jgi:ligand-binding sensor domain-containing protein